VALLVGIAVSATPVTAWAAGRGLEPREQLSQADMRLARAAVIQRRDLIAGYKPSSIPAPKGERCAGYAPDLSRTTLTGQAFSAFHAGPNVQITSTVRIFASQRQAVDAFTAESKAGMLSCTRRSLTKLFAGLRSKGVRARFYSASMPKLQRLGDLSVTYRVGFAVNSCKTTCPFVFDLIRFQLGRSVATVTTTTLGIPSRQTEVGLTNRVWQRLPVS
jgi:hypothetical protein